MNRLPHGRGSVSTSKRAVPILNRARKQAVSREQAVL